MGKIYPDAVNMKEDDFLEKVIGFLLVRHLTISSALLLLLVLLRSFDY